MACSLFSLHYTSLLTTCCMLAWPPLAPTHTPQGGLYHVCMHLMDRSLYILYHTTSPLPSPPHPTGRPLPRPDPPPPRLPYEAPCLHDAVSLGALRGRHEDLPLHQLASPRGLAAQLVRENCADSHDRLHAYAGTGAGWLWPRNLLAPLFPFAFLMGARRGWRHWFQSAVGCCFTANKTRDSYAVIFSSPSSLLPLSYPLVCIICCRVPWAP